MNEMPIGSENKIPATEAEETNTRKLAEGESTGWEKERTFSVEEVMAVVQGMDAKAGELKVTNRILSHEGVLVVVNMRAPGSASSYSFMLKGNHGPRNVNKGDTRIERIDYSGPDSEDVEYAEEVAGYKDGVWVKK